jgi:hypothetical protein
LTAVAGRSDKKAVILRPLAGRSGPGPSPPTYGGRAGTRKKIQHAEMFNHADGMGRRGQFFGLNSSPIHLDP